jgi:hypothetical protein
MRTFCVAAAVDLDRKNERAGRRFLQIQEVEKCSQNILLEDGGI